MNIGELERLSELHRSGALSDEEFNAAKAKLLSAGHSSESLGRAANRGVTVIGIWMAVSLVLMLAFFFFFFMPQWNKQQESFDKGREEFKQQWDQGRKDFDDRWKNKDNNFSGNSLSAPSQTGDGLTAKK